MAKLESLTVRGYKSIHSLEDFRLGQLNVLIGANGAGKSNFISLFNLLARVVERRLQVFIAEQDGPEAILFGGRKQTERIEIEFTFGKNAYAFSLVPAGDRLIFDQEETRFFGDWKTTTHPLGSGHNESRLKHAEETGEDSFASYVWTAIMRWAVYHFHDTSTTAPVRQSQAVRDNIYLKPDAGNLGPFLRHLREQFPEHYQQIIETVRLAAPFFGDTIYRRNTEERMELEWFHANDPDTVLGPRQLSDGTLRFLCLTTLLLQPSQMQPDLMLIDEPELGLHPYALSLLAEMLRQASDARQLVISTQSADLVNELTPDDIVVVDRKDGESRFQKLDADHLKEWLEDYALGDMWKMNIFGGRPNQ